MWSHLELSYFRNIVPADAIRDLVVKQQPAEAQLLRAEILLTTPSAFVLPQDWQGSADRPERQASLEYIEVQSTYLGEYRDIMRTYIGPAAAKLVRANRIGTFRTMETAAVLYRDPALTIDWNQIHLCEVEADGFNGFGHEFDAALHEVSPDGGFAGVFAGLERMRTIPRWTFNDPVVEADAALGREGATKSRSPPGSVTWASAETGSEKAVEVRFGPTPRSVNQGAASRASVAGPRCRPGRTSVHG